MNEGQASLFGLPYVTEEDKTLTDKFLEWVWSPTGTAAYNLFVQFALEAQASGAKIGAKAIWERMRWEARVGRLAGDDYKLNNSYVSRVARMAASENTNLANFFEFRELRSE